MAPEQLEDSHLVGPRADIYALAATLYRLLTGAAPFAKDDRKTPLQKLRALATQSAPPIRERRADLPEELAAIIDRALRREPNERFASMSEFAEALGPWCAGYDLAALARTTSAASSSSLSPWERVGVREPSLVGRNSPSERRGAITPNERQTSDRVPHPAFGHPLPAGEGTKPPRTWLVALLTLIGFVALGLVITVETNKGTLIVESVRDGVEVRVKKSGKTVEQLELTTGPKSARLASGDYEIEIIGEADGLQIQNSKFVLKRGDTVVAKVTEQPPKVTGSSGPDPRMLPNNPSVAQQTLGQDGGGTAGQVANTPPVEPDDEKPNPTAKSIEQGLASHPDHAGETKYRKALTTPVDLKFEDISLEDGLQFLQEFAPVPIWLDKAALAEEGLATDTPLTLKLSGVSLGTTFRFLLRPLKLTSFWDGTSIRVTTLAKAKEQLVSRSYPVGRSLPMVRKAVRLRQELGNKAIKAFLDAGGDLKKLPGGGSGGSGGGFFAVPTPVKLPHRPCAGGSRVSALLESSEKPSSAETREPLGQAWGKGQREFGERGDSLDDRLHFQFGGGGGFLGDSNTGGQGRNVSPNQLAAGYFGELFALLTDASWMTTDGEGGTLQLLGDVLIIRQTRPVHEQIEAVLRVLEQASTGPLPKSPVEIRRPDYPFEADQTLREKLSKPVEFEMKDAPLTDAMQFLEDFTQTRILLDREKLDEEGVPTDAPLTASLKNLPFQVVLHRLLDPLQLSADVEEGLLVVTSKSTFQDRLVLKSYEIRDLFARGVDEQELLSGLESGTTGPWSKRHGEGGKSMIFADRLLFVTQTRQNHEEIDAFLRDLRSQLSEQPRKKPLAQAKPQPTSKASTPVATNNPGTAQPTLPAQPANDPKQPRYDGKTFDEWLAVLDVERSPARLADALQALRLLHQDHQSTTVAQRLLKVFRTVDSSATYGDSEKRRHLSSDVDEMLAALPLTVLETAAIDELKSGNARSRKFVFFSVISPKRRGSLDSESLARAVLQVSHDNDVGVQTAALGWLVQQPVRSWFPNVETGIKTRFREALSDKTPEVALSAVRGLLDSEPDTAAVVDALKRLIGAPPQTSGLAEISLLQGEAMKLAAIMGPRAAAVAPAIAPYLLLRDSNDRASFVGDVGFSIGQRGGPRSVQLSIQSLATLALARMGKAGAEALPTIEAALKQHQDSAREPFDPPGQFFGGIGGGMNPFGSGASLSQRGASTRISFREFLLGTKARIADRPAADPKNKPAEVKQEDILLVQSLLRLLEIEQLLLEEHYGPEAKRPELRELDQKIKAVEEEFNALRKLFNEQLKNLPRKSPGM